MIQLTISGDDPTKFYNEAMNALLLLAQGGNQVFKPSTPPVVDQPVAPVEVSAPDGGEPLPNPPVAEEAPAPKKRGPKPRVEKIIEAVAEPDPVLPVEKPREFTLDDMRDRVKAIVQAHKDRGNEMPECVAYARKLFAPFGIRLAADLKPEQFDDFWAASQAYLDGTGQVTDAFDRHGIKLLRRPVRSPICGASCLKPVGDAGIFAASGTSSARRLQEARRSKRASLHALHGRDNALAVALKKFEEITGGEISETIDAERARIHPMLKQLSGWKRPGELLASQIKIECWLDGLSVPLIGYVDFSFDAKDVDLKTAKAMPSKPKPDHVRQVSIYRHGHARRPARCFM